MKNPKTLALLTLCFSVTLSAMGASSVEAPNSPDSQLLKVSEQDCATTSPGTGEGLFEDLGTKLDRAFGAENRADCYVESRSTRYCAQQCFHPQYPGTLRYTLYERVCCSNGNCGGWSWAGTYCSNEGCHDAS
ncbi:MAG: hypothetical protein K0U98_10190 [Deltaproteobacteria bacterium]|nr:hypothetical protein [Deltaproteobacteria bacterium]